MHRRLKGDEAGLVGYWNFDDGSPTDRSIYANHGQLHDGAEIVSADLILAGSNEPFSAALVRALTQTDTKNFGEIAETLSQLGSKATDAVPFYKLNLVSTIQRFNFKLLQHCIRLILQQKERLFLF
jgi:hypothetical protein